MHDLVTATGMAAITRVNHQGAVMCSYNQSQQRLPDIPEAGTEDFLAARSTWTAFRPTGEQDGLLPIDDMLANQPWKAPCPECKRLVFLGHAACPHCGQALSRDVAAPASLARLARDTGSRVAALRRGNQQAASTSGTLEQREVFRTVVELATKEANDIKRLNHRARLGKNLPASSSLQPTDFPLQGVADRYFKDATYREGLRKVRPYRQTKFPMAGFNNDPMDDDLWRRLTAHLPSTSPYLTWTGGTEVGFLEHLAQTRASQDNVEVAGVRMSRREAVRFIKEDLADSSSSSSTSRRTRSRRRQWYPGMQSARSYTPPPDAGGTAETTHTPSWPSSSWQGWQGWRNRQSGEWQ